MRFVDFVRVSAGAASGGQEIPYHRVVVNGGLPLFVGCEGLRGSG